jgi:hypothetical protein
VSIPEANELARLFTVAMFLLAGVPESIAGNGQVRGALQTNIGGLYNVTSAQLQIGDLTLQNMDKLDRTGMEAILQSVTAAYNTEQQILAHIRAMLDLGTSSVPAVNSEFKSLYRQLVDLCLDDYNGVDPRPLKPDINNSKLILDPKQYETSMAFLRNLKRTIIRLVQNMSVYGTMGTYTLVNKWSGVVNDSVKILSSVAQTNVVSADQDDRYAWTLLAAVTGQPRSTVKAYVVNALSGGDLLTCAVAAYAEMQKGGLSNDSDNFLGSIFYDKTVTGNRLSPTIDISRGEVLKLNAGMIRDNPIPNWG